jgi:phospholipid transport system substrate-binding protein
MSKPHQPGGNRIQRWCVAILLITFIAAAAAEDLHPAAVVVIQTVDEMQTRMRAEREALQQDQSRVNQLVEEIVLPHLDFEYISASVLGKHWRTASDDQRQRFREAFKSLLLSIYAKALVDNMDSKIEFEPVRAASDATDVTVRSSIPQESEFPLPINYSMELICNEWKVYDVEIDGLSLVTNYRTSFAKEINQSSLENLIKILSDSRKEASS